MASRIARAAIYMARDEGMKVGLVRPITLWPFPNNVIAELAKREEVKGFIDVELNLGQMVDDVRLAVDGKKEVAFFGRTAGMLPDEEELFGRIKVMYSRDA
jgi:2-oxoglutarate ferredoxin oxidoreductase subunit alpha